MPTFGHLLCLEESTIQYQALTCGRTGRPKEFAMKNTLFALAAMCLMPVAAANADRYSYRYGGSRDHGYTSRSYHYDGHSSWGYRSHGYGDWRGWRSSWVYRPSYPHYRSYSTWSFSVGFPTYYSSDSYCSTPYYYRPYAPVYVEPAPVYYPPPVYYYRPTYHCAPPVHYYRPSGWWFSIGYRGRW
jgi:hypothetical protein